MNHVNHMVPPINHMPIYSYSEFTNQYQNHDYNTLASYGTEILSCFVKPVVSSYCYTKLQEHFNVDIVFRKRILIPHFHHHQVYVNLIYSDDFITFFCILESS